MALRAALLGSRASCSQPFASPACLGSGRAPRGRVAARPAGRGPARCVRTRAAQAEVSTEKDVAAISDALRQAIAAEDYPLAARLRDELQRLPEVLLPEEVAGLQGLRTSFVAQLAGQSACQEAGPSLERSRPLGLWGHASS